MQPPTIEELSSVISQLPNDKAAVPLGIHNEMIKYLRYNTHKLL